LVSVLPILVMIKRKANVKCGLVYKIQRLSAP